MFDKTDIRAAVEAGAISDEGAKRFEAFLKARNDPERMLDPENLRFLSNFNDVFLTIGIVVLMTGLGFLSAISVTNMLGVSSMVEPNSFVEAQAIADKIRWTLILTPIPLIVGAWLLAEYFCGKRRLLLPSMALAIVIAWASAALAAGLASFMVDPVVEAGRVEGGMNPWSILTGISYSGFAAGVVAAGLFFWRFRLPFSLFLLAGAIAGLWPWGGGEIVIQKGARLLFMPQRPYIPLGTLRRAASCHGTRLLWCSMPVSRITSPSLSPAFSAALFGMTFSTTAPEGVLSPSDSATSLVTAPGWTPSTRSRPRSRAWP